MDQKAIVGDKNATEPTSYAPFVATAIIGMIALLGMAFWILSGPNLFFSLIKSGLSWCL